MNIDKQRISAVHSLEALGYTYRRGEWLPAAVTITPLPLTEEADTMHAVLMRRADRLAGCAAGSDEDAELKAIVDAIEAYEAKRWPLGNAPGRAVEVI